jgi:2-polyprenyl-3-methyl-5-hydroxy-6-metoxy-1,4-benzoquinol methylase
MSNKKNKRIYDDFGEHYFLNRTKNNDSTINDLIEVPSIINLTKDKKYATVLDIGCSFGFYSKHFSSLGSKVTGIDISSKMINIAKRYCDDSNITFINDEFENVNLDNDKFDLILGTFMLGYFNDLDLIFKKISHFLSKKGEVILSMLHPLLTSKSSKINETYILEDYFNRNPYSTNFIIEDKKLNLKRWSLEEITKNLDKHDLFINLILEPKFENIAHSKNIYSKLPSIMIFRINNKIS